jgi:tripartite-type tricarboxylate transporter receptor subunit TctC
LLKARAGIDLLLVPYKGSGPAVTDLIGGQVDLIMDAPSVTMPYIKAGRLRAIAVTRNQRLTALPDVPTFEEAGLKNFEASGWQGLLVPAGTPAALAKLSGALTITLVQPEVRERFIEQRLDPAPSTPEQFGAYIGDREMGAGSEGGKSQSRLSQIVWNSGAASTVAATTD